jgi:hypothetical protein
VLPSRGLGLAGMTGDRGAVSIRTPGGEVTVDAAKMGEAARRREEASKGMEAAQKSGDPAAAGKALGAVMGAMTGAGGTPIAAQDLKALLPDALGGLKRESVEASAGQAMGIGGSSAKAAYVDGNQRVQLTITDLGGLGGLAAFAGWTSMTLDKETPDKVEKAYKEGNRTVHEEYRKDGSHGEYAVILANGVIVEAQGDKVEMASLKKIVAGVDLGSIESLKRAAKQ